MRNKNREEMKVVPESVIERMFTNANNLQLNKRIKVTFPDEWSNSSFLNDFSHYKEVVHIGDIHGSIEPLKELFKEGVKDDTLYIFVGDYTDRGINNAEVLLFLNTLAFRKNVILLEGNHEQHLRKWALNERTNSREFERFTKRELERKGVKRKEVLKILNSLQTAVFYKYIVNDEEIKVLVNHGGIIKLPKYLDDLSSEQFIRGIGNYDFDVDKAFFENNLKNVYQIHGHRNLMKHPIRPFHNSFNLEGGVELGGHLRVVKLTSSGFETLKIKNNTYSDRFKTNKKTNADNWSFLEELRKDSEF